jgi:hypothetical protein
MKKATTTMRQAMMLAEMISPGSTMVAFASV